MQSFFRKVSIHHYFNSYEDCIRDCEMALSLNGKFSKGYSRMAKSYMAIGKYTRALEAYKKALEVTPGSQELIGEEATCRTVILIVSFSSRKCQENI